jgi:Mg2+-importing ATPase
MAPLQLLIQNLLYDLSQLSIPFDRMDPEDGAFPSSWAGSHVSTAASSSSSSSSPSSVSGNMAVIKDLARFMLFMGPVSTIFDVATFLTSWYLYHLDSSGSEFSFDEQERKFQTNWFVVGLATQTLVVHVIRSRKTPCLDRTYQYNPIMVVLTLTLIGVALALPNVTPIQSSTGFVSLEPTFYGFVALFVIAYCLLASAAKNIYIRLFQTWL